MHVSAATAGNCTCAAKLSSTLAKNWKVRRGEESLTPKLRILKLSVKLERRAAKKKEKAKGYILNPKV